MSRYDDVDHLLLDLDNERRYKDQIELENTDLEKTIVELENYLRHLDEVATTGSAEDNEWKTRYEIQKAHDLHLADHKAWLEAELAETEWKLHTGSYPDAMNCNLDLLTELELVRLVKHMERIKNDYYTSVCDTDYKTEKETKEFHHFDEMRRCYKNDLRHYMQAMERMKMDDLLERQAATTPPLTLSPPSYVRWLDSQSVDDSLSKSPSRCPHHKTKGSSRSKSLNSKERRRSSSKSPTRSKSRCDCDKKSKKKDEEEHTTAPESEQGDEGSGEKGSGGEAKE